MCVVRFQAAGRFIKLITLLELPAKGHMFNTMSVNQCRRGMCTQVGAESQNGGGWAVKRLSLFPMAHVLSQGHKIDNHGTLKAPSNTEF